MHAYTDIFQIGPVNLQNLQIDKRLWNWAYLNYRPCWTTGNVILVSFQIRILAHWQPKMKVFVILAVSFINIISLVWVRVVSICFLHFLFFPFAIIMFPQLFVIFQIYFFTPEKQKWISSIASRGVTGGKWFRALRVAVTSLTSSRRALFAYSMRQRCQAVARRRALLGPMDHRGGLGGHHSLQRSASQ
jgi:hypothetical protein